MQIAFTMQLHPNQIKEYTHRHNPIWPELEEVLKQHGVIHYSIFFEESSHKLFGVAEIESLEKWQKIADTAICRKWWEHMAPLMETNADGSPRATTLERVFHIER